MNIFYCILFILDNYTLITIGGVDFTIYGPTKEVYSVPLMPGLSPCSTIGSLPEGLSGNSATYLPDGSILTCGGIYKNGNPTNKCLQWKSNKWINTMNLTTNM